MYDNSIHLSKTIFELGILKFLFTYRKSFWKDFFTSRKNTFKRLHLETNERTFNNNVLVQNLGQLFDCCERLERFSIQYVKDVEIYNLIGAVSVDFPLKKLSKVIGVPGRAATFWDWEFVFCQEPSFDERCIELDLLELSAAKRVSQFKPSRVLFNLMSRYVCNSRPIESLKVRCVDGIEDIQWTDLKRLIVEVDEENHEEALMGVRENPEMVYEIFAHFNPFGFFAQDQVLLNDNNSLNYRLASTILTFLNDGLDLRSGQNCYTAIS